MVKNLLIYVNPPAGEDGRMVVIAADLVEALTAATGDTQRPETPRIGVVAEATYCLEIALPMLGREHVRALDRNERLVSPVMLFPFAERTVPASAGRWRAAVARLRELAAIGVVTPLNDRFESGDSVNMEQALGLAVDGPPWELMVQLGEVPPRLDVMRSVMLNTRVVRMVTGDYRPEVDRLLDLMPPLAADGPLRSDEQLSIRRRAVEDALSFAGFMSQIEAAG
jgi:hypothetical protein